MCWALPGTSHGASTTSCAGVPGARPGIHGRTCKQPSETGTARPEAAKSSSHFFRRGACLVLLVEEDAPQDLRRGFRGVGITLRPTQAPAGL